MVLVTLATIRPKAEKVPAPMVTSKKTAQRFPQSCMWNATRQIRISMTTGGRTRR